MAVTCVAASSLRQHSHRPAYQKILVNCKQPGLTHHQAFVAEVLQKVRHLKRLRRISNKHLNCFLLYSSLKLFSAFINYKSCIHGDERHLFELFLTDQISELTEVDIVSDMLLLSDFAVYNK